MLPLPGARGGGHISHIFSHIFITSKSLSQSFQFMGISHISEVFQTPSAVNKAIDIFHIVHRSSHYNPLEACEQNTLLGS